MNNNKGLPGWPEQFTPKIPDNANNPFTSGLAGGLEFMKNFWSNAPTAIPGMAVPMVDVEELEKRIKELKAVESWLDVNTNMLRATIQTLEVQRNTVSMMQALGNQMSGARDNVNEALAHAFRTASASTQAGSQAGMQPEAPAASAAGASATSTPPAKSGLPPGWPSSTSPAPAQPASTSASAPAPTEGQSEEKSGRKRASKKSAAGAAESETPSPEQSAFSPNAWLDFLHDQFNKVAASALATDMPAKDAEAAKRPVKASKKAAKKASRKSAPRKAAAKKVSGGDDRKP